MIDLKEVLLANGLAMLMMCYLLNCRRKNRENTRVEDRIYDGMCAANLGGAFFETVSFLVDGASFPGGLQINYLANSLCYLGTVTIGFLWGLYTDLRVHRNPGSTARRARLLAIPWLVEVVAIVLNLFGTGVLFTITDGNVYERGAGVTIGYVSLIFYFVFSMITTLRSKRGGSDLYFFPILYFVGPCLAGVLIQFLCYGVTTSWISVATALVFVQMQTYAEGLYRDELSGLFSRRFLERELAKRVSAGKGGLFGIMIDVNDFKKINDQFGHSTGDRAIRVMGDVLFRSVPKGAKAIRYAGDEFIVLLPDADEAGAVSAMSDIRAELARANESSDEPFCLDVAMGYARLGQGDDAESFLRSMDARMYEDKRAFHQSK